MIGVNNAPTIQISAPHYLFPSNQIRDILVQDTDAGNWMVDAWVNTSHVAFSVGKSQPITTVEATANYLHIRGTISGVAIALQTITYRNVPNYLYNDSMIVSVCDNGYFGTGGAYTTTLAIPIYICTWLHSTVLPERHAKVFLVPC